MKSKARRSGLLLCLLLVIQGWATVGHAQSSQSRLYEGRRIQELEMSGAISLTEQDLLFYLGLEVGSPYDPALLNKNMLELWDRDLIDDIYSEVTPVDGGVKVAIHIVERPLLISIDYQGLKKLKRSDMTEIIDRERLELYEGLYLSKGELARFEAAIEAAYAEKGYRFADATVSLEPVSEYEQRVVVFVDEGNKVKIGRVSFDGNEVFSQSKLRGSMEKTKKSNILTKLRKRDIYNPATFEEDLDKIREVYHNAGYKNLVIGDAELDVIEKGVDKEGRVKERKLSVIIPLEEGERWKLGEIHIEGNEVLPEQLLRAAFAEPKGGWLRQDVIDSGLDQIGDFYQNTGYMFAQVESEIQEAGDLVADLFVTIDEGDQFRIGRIEFSGNEETRDRVLRRNLRVQEGMVFNSAQLKNSIMKLQQMDFFAIHEEDPVEIDINDADQLVNLTIKGDEAERTELTFGGGFSEIDGFFLQAGMRTRNFLGRGETLGVSIQTGRYREQFDVSYFVPWLFDKPQNVGIQIFSRDLDYDLLTNQRFARKEQGITLTYQRVIGAWQNLSLSYTNADFEDFRSFQVVPGLDPLEQSFAFSKSALIIGWTLDRRDSFLEATRGRMFRASFEYSGGFLGGEDWMIRPTLEAAYFKPISLGSLRTVAAFHIVVGIVKPFGTNDDGTDREILFLNKYFLGGESSVRGFEFRTIWVRDPVTGESILERGFYQGGEKSFVLNLEYQFLIGGPVRLVPFIDMGNVYSADQDFDFSHMRYSGGIELRINVPLFGAPLRFIYAENLDPLNLTGFNAERFKSFDFSIGTAF